MSESAANVDNAAKSVDTSGEYRYIGDELNARQAGNAKGMSDSEIAAAQKNIGEYKSKKNQVLL